MPSAGERRGSCGMVGMSVVLGLVPLLTPARVQVPSVVGSSISVATQRLQNEGFEVQPVRDNSSQPRNTVIGQNPSGGSTADEGSTITLTISDGRALAAVPDVVGSGRRDARKALLDAKFLVDVWRGQKTGFFLDQRENRFLVRRLSKASEVLNCFCYTGGFSVNAALGGATRVFSVDQDADAVALARENFALNGLDAAANDFLAADVFELLSSFKDEGRTFDVVVLDPPAFAKNRASVEAAARGYKEINLRAIKMLEPGGTLITSTCSYHMSEEAFLNCIADAAADAGRSAQVIEKRMQARDHPVLVSMPETYYLKCMILRVA